MVIACLRVDASSFARLGGWGVGVRVKVAAGRIGVLALRQEWHVYRECVKIVWEENRGCETGAKITRKD